MPNMNAVSSTELTAMRAEVAAATCDTACIVKRKATTVDGFGTSTVVYNTASTTKVGLRSPNSKELALYAEMIGASKAWMVRFAWGYDVRELDHLVIGSDTLIVQADVSLSSYSALTTMLAMEVV